jgi:hypothetical protein
MKKRFIDDWKVAHRFMSVRLAGLLALASLAYDYLPAIQTYVGPASGSWVAVASAAIIIARILSQGGKQ